MLIQVAFICYLQISKLKGVSTLKFLLCPNRPFSIWDRLGCLESIVPRQEKRTDPCYTGLTVCISVVHFRNTERVVVAGGCNPPPLLEIVRIQPLLLADI